MCKRYELPCLVDGDLLLIVLNPVLDDIGMDAGSEWAFIARENRPARGADAASVVAAGSTI
jgi:hypothetical protein